MPENETSMEYQYAAELPEVDSETLSGDDQFVMFDDTTGKRTHLSELTEYLNDTLDAGNKINTVKVDGTPLVPDANKAVDIDLSGKVDKVTGKGLSTNDFTNGLKDKIDKLPYLASDDGDYVVYQNNGYMELVRFDPENYKIYGAKWNKTSRLMNRTKDAVGITTDTTNFCHNGSINDSYSNPFDAIYPWSDIYVCNVDLDDYRNGTDLMDCITAVYGDPDFTYVGTESLFVGVHYPEFWYKSVADTSGIEYLVSPRPAEGYTHFEECIRGVSHCIDAGNNKVTAGSGVPLTNVAVSTIHSRANSSGFDLCDIYDMDGIIMLYLVEYANMNIQNALGDGCSSCYRQDATDAITAVSTDSTEGTTTITITDSALSSVIYKGAQIDIGSSVGATTYRAIVKDFTVDGSTYTIVLDRVLSLVTTGMIASVHGFSACEFDILDVSVGNTSGYIGTNSKANVYYRGAKIFGNRYDYILGIYRQTTTNHLWLCPKTDDPQAYDAINTTKHTDTGVILPVMTQGAWCTVWGNAQSIPGLSAFLAIGTSSGSSTDPVGDQQYVPANTAGNTVLLFGGYANSGWLAGVFCGIWANDADYSPWNFGGSPILRKHL